jgi:hypothetical protein
MVLGGGMAAAAVGGDDAVVMQLGAAEGEETVVTVNCPDQTGLGCDLCRTILEFGLRITRAGTSPFPIGQIHRFFSSFPDLFFHRYLSASSALLTTESLSPFFYILAKLPATTNLATVHVVSLINSFTHQ